ncbi:hypothetical protein BGW39_002783 [Mortierella sp. 14UC]|nr:hypothetical protein BGW39_002783 [Mortierella sp. 14UC]
MDSSSSIKGDSNFAETYSSSTSVAAAAPESSTLAVKLSEDPEGQVQQESHDHDSKSHPQDHRHSLKEPDQDSHTNTQALRRSRSGRLLRSTVQYDERDIRSSSPDNSPDAQDNYGESSRSSYPNQGARSMGRGHQDQSRQSEHDHSGRRNSSASPQDDRSPHRQTGGSDSEGGNRNESHRYRNENMNEIMSEEEQDEDGSGEDADGNNEEGSESMDTNSSKNDDGSDNLVVSMYGSPSLVKVRSMFIDKLYKMVEDPSIQHLISWAKEGDMFYVFNCIELSNSILPKFFKHNNWQSFVRQLNMYGFHKKESTMNRRNPESQRWQFYHPDFQRDRPHLRSNIKRKSARSINIAPTFSRVMFDEKGPYIQQDYQTRPFNGLGGHNRSQSSNHPQDPSRHGHHMHGGPQGPGHFPFPGPMGLPHRQPHPDPSQRPPGPRHMGDYRQGPPGHPVEPMLSRDDKDHPGMKHMPPSHPQHGRRDPGHPPHHQHYSGPPHQQHSYANPHQRQHSYAGPGSQGPYSPDHPYGPKSQGPPHGYTPVHGPGHGPLHPGQGPPHPAAGHGRPENQGHGHSPNREAGFPEHGHDPKQGPMVSGGHFRSQSAPGLDPRRPEASRQPHPFSQQHDQSRSPPHNSLQPHGPRDSFGAHPHPSHPHASHRQQGSMDGNAQKLPPAPAGFEGGGGHPAGEESMPMHRGSQTKHPLSPMEHAQGHPGGSDHPSPSHVHHLHAAEQHRRNQSLATGPGASAGGPMEKEDPNRRLSPSQPAIAGGHGRPTLPIPSPSASQKQLAVPMDHAHGSSSGGDSLPGAHGIDPNLHPNPQDLVPRTVKQLESRLFYVEDAYMSLRQFAQELQNVQISQEHTIAWMRDRIEQLSEVSTPRVDSITSPPLMHGGIVPSKRKADYSPGDAREWSRRGPEHQPQRQGPPGSGPVPPPSNGPGSRYEQSGFHPSQPQQPQQQQPQSSPHPPHHAAPPSHPQHPHPQQQQQQSLVPPPPQSQHQRLQQQQQQHQQQRHSSPSMNDHIPQYSP